MTPEGSKCFLIVQRERGAITMIQVFEDIVADASNKFKICLTEGSQAFQVRIASDGRAVVRKFNDHGKGYFMYAWHDETNFCSNNFEVYEAALRAHVPSPILEWLTSRI
jgi:hypothetical protein